MIKLSKTTEKLVEEISKLTVLDLSELVTALQDKLGVSAMPVAAAPAAAPAEGGEKKKEEKKEDPAKQEAAAAEGLASLFG